MHHKSPLKVFVIDFVLKSYVFENNRIQKETKIVIKIYHYQIQQLLLPEMSGEEKLSCLNFRQNVKLHVPLVSFNLSGIFQ